MKSFVKFFPKIKSPGIKHNIFSFFSMVILCLIIVCSCAICNNLIDGILNAKTVSFFFVIGLMSLYWGIENRVIDSSTSFNRLDLTVALYFIWVIFNNSVHDFGFLLKQNLENLGLLLLYFFGKKFFSDIKSFRFLIIFFLLFIVSQIVIAVLQWFRYIPSYSLSFKFTGFFFNPSPFAIFLASLSMICLVIYLYSINKLLKLSSIAIFCLSTLPIVIAQSRSAWIGFFIGLVFMLFIRFKKSKLILRLSKNWVVLIIYVLPIAAIAIYCLYHFKQKSADGRLLIWKHSYSMINDNPILGLGQGGVRANFLKYQSQYFKTNQVRIFTEGRLAGEVWYSFNDLLQILAEQGLIGLLLFLSVLFYLIKYSLGFLKIPFILHKKEDLILSLGSMSCLAVILSAGMFSYPLAILSIQIVFIIALSSISASHDKIKIRFDHHRFKLMPYLKKPYFSYALFCFGACFLSFGNVFFKAYKLGYQDSQVFFHGNILRSLERYNYEIKWEPWYVLDKFSHLIDCEKTDQAINLLLEAEKKSPDIRYYYLLGEMFINKKEYLNAEKQYIFLNYALPKLIKPKLCLQRLYIITGEAKKFNIKRLEIDNLRTNFF